MKFPVNEVIIQFTGPWLILRLANKSYGDVIFTGAVMLKILQMLEKDQSAFSDISLFCCMCALNFRSSSYLHKGSQASMTLGKCSLF